MPILTAEEAQTILDFAMASGSSYSVEYWTGFRDALQQLRDRQGSFTEPIPTAPACAAESDSVTD
jgi:hypothetical protein